MAQEANIDLETFRKQWQEEVTARAKASSSNEKSAKPSDPSDPSNQGIDKKVFDPPRGHSILKDRIKNEEHADGSDPIVYHDIEESDTRQNSGEGLKGVHRKREIKEEPSSALEHYEYAMERELQGNLGDSVRHYTKAFRVSFFFLHI